MRDYIPQLYQAIPEYVSLLFKRNGSPVLVYHNLEHTERVVSRTMEIRSFYRLGEQDSFVLFAAAWFHDTGQLFGIPEDHEDRSIALMEEFMSLHKIDREIVGQVKGCIQATKIPHKPETFLQEIMCDADTYNLGTEEFLRTDDQLREELSLRGFITLEGWNESTLLFLARHRFFTSYCRDLLQAGKQRNIDIVKARITGAVKPNYSKPTDMKWTSKNFPFEMEDLEPRVREKAIEIANQLKEEGQVRELSIVDEAIRQAIEWFQELEG